MTPPFFIQHHFSLRSLNTFGVESCAASYVQIDSVDQLQAIRQDAALCALPRLVLGGGSNILLTGDFPGLVLHMCTRGIRIVHEDANATYVCVAAGESWHGLVEWTLAQGLNGLENLSLIPGSVGAAPIQNIGAYGVEMKEYFHSLRAFDFDTGQIMTLDGEQCAFGYRDSRFKRDLRHRAVILEVTFALPKVWRPTLEYAELTQALAGIAQPTAQDISRAVVAIRTRKLPDPTKIGNAGSFFKNPVISAEERHALAMRYPQLVSYAQPDGSFKLAAGWLIDQCGWKGQSLGQAGVYDKQALVLINHGQASGQDIMQLAHAIQADVAAHFGVKLEPEPVFVP